MTPTVDFDGILLASPTDIGLMKLAAINSRGTRRDFVDLYCLREHVNLDRLLELAAVKYAVRALAYFDNAERQPMSTLLRPVQWQNVRAY